jgi:hypothetical protein
MITMAYKFSFINGLCDLFFSNMTILLHYIFYYCYFSMTWFSVPFFGALNVAARGHASDTPKPTKLPLNQ